MTDLQGLKAALTRAEASIAALGPKPAGDPEGLHRAAVAIRAEGELAGRVGTSARQLSTQLVFEGPAARRFDTSTRGVSWAIRSLAKELHELAERLDRDAARIEERQHRWERDVGRFRTAATELADQIRKGAR